MTEPKLPDIFFGRAGYRCNFLSTYLTLGRDALQLCKQLAISSWSQIPARVYTYLKHCNYRTQKQSAGGVL